jgi:alpha-L-rhamnosidase
VPIYVPFLPLMPFPVQPDRGWGDAAVVVPWVLYQRSGDVGLLADQWASMTAWMDAFERAAGPDLDFAGVPFMLGDWLDPWRPRTPPAPPGRRGSSPPPPTWPARRGRLAEAAGVLGYGGSRYADLAQRAASRFRAEFVTSTGRVAFPAQTAYALALEFDLLEPGQREHAQQLLAAQVAADGWHIGTGFLGTPLVTDALTDAGEIASEYELLLQRENPSWLYPVTMGATTIWERWDSMLPDGSINPGEMTSFNQLRLRRCRRLPAPGGGGPRPGDGWLP